MTITAEHRSDNLLQKNVDEGVPKGAEGTYVDRVTLPHHEAILGFLNTAIIGQQFEDAAAIQEVLNTWPQYAEEIGLDLHHDWAQMSIKGEQIVGPEGMGGFLTLALLKDM